VPDDTRASGIQPDRHRMNVDGPGPPSAGGSSKATGNVRERRRLPYEGAWSPEEGPWSRRKRPSIVREVPRGRVKRPWIRGRGPWPREKVTPTSKRPPWLVAQGSLARSARTLARSTRALARGPRTFARSARPLARSARPLARSARPLARSARTLAHRPRRSRKVSSSGVRAPSESSSARRRNLSPHDRRASGRGSDRVARALLLPEA
jgi:hypothetical protein